MKLYRQVIIVIIGTAIVVAILLGLNSRGRKEETVLARVDEETITLSDFNDRIARLPEQYQNMIGENKERFLDDIIVELLLCKEAIRRGIDKQEDTKEVLKEARRKILMAKLIEEAVEKKVGVEEAELRDYYEKNKEKFIVPERLRASHILVKTEEKAAEVLEKVSGGADFEELAKTESIDITNRRGGDIGYFTKGQLIPEFEEACSKLEIGEISPIVKTSFGYHIIKLTDRQPAHAKEFEEVRTEIARGVLSLKKRERFNLIVEDLKDKASIKKNLELIKDTDEEEKKEDE